MAVLVPIHRRRSLRRHYRARCQAVELGRFQLIGERILDLSPRGALLACDASVHPGDRVMLSFRAPRDGAWIDAEGEVARVIEGWRAGDPGYCAGVRFLHVERDVRAELLVRLAGFPPPVPTRRSRVDYAETVRRIALAV